MPQRILDLSKTYEDAQKLVLEDFKPLPDGACGAPSNKVIKDMIEIVKGQIDSMVLHLDKLKIFINLNIPKIEDGNNFGVNVQEVIADMLKSGKDSALAFIGELPKYFQVRAKLISKALKF